MEAGYAASNRAIDSLRHAETFENRVLIVHETCMWTWITAKKPGILEIIMAPGIFWARISEEHEKEATTTILTFYFSGFFQCSR